MISKSNDEEEMGASLELNWEVEVSDWDDEEVESVAWKICDENDGFERNQNKKRKKNDLVFIWSKNSNDLRLKSVKEEARGEKEGFGDSRSDLVSYTKFLQNYKNKH